jgi:hypothetical protein
MQYPDRGVLRRWMSTFWLAPVVASRPADIAREKPHPGSVSASTFAPARSPAAIAARKSGGNCSRGGVAVATCSIAASSSCVSSGVAGVSGASSLRGLSRHHTTWPARHS